MNAKILSLALLALCLVLSFLFHDILRVIFSPNSQTRRDFRRDIERLRRERREALDVRQKIPADANSKFPAEWVSSDVTFWALVVFFIFVSLVLVFSQAMAGHI